MRKLKLFCKEQAWNAKRQRLLPSFCRPFAVIIGLLLTLGVGNVWGEDTEYYSYTFTAKQFSDNTTAVELGGITWTPATSWTVGTGYWGYDSNSKGQQWGSGSHQLNTLTLTSDVDVSNVTKVTINASIASSGGCKLSVKIGDTSIGSEQTLTTTATDYNFTSATGLTGEVKITLTNQSKKKAQYIKSITIYTNADSGGDDPVAVTGVTLDQSEAEVAVGKTITLTPTVAPSNATTKTVTWESDDEDVATVDGGVVTGVAEGTATITVKTTDGNKTATCEVTVTAAPAAVNYEKVTAEPADWSGEYILVYEADATNARVWKGADEANNYAEATIATGVIAAPEGAAVLTIAKVAESSPVVYTIKVGEKYIGQTSDANGMKIQDAAINNSISYNTTDAAVDIVASSAHLRYNSASSSYFRYYKSATYSGQKKIQLYKKVEQGATVKQAAGLAYETSAYLVKANGSLATPTLTNPNSLTVTYTSSNTDVAEVAADGSVTIKAVGKAEITASSVETETFKAGSAKYTIYVAEQAGTAEDPLTEASAKALIDLGCTLNAYVRGTVATVGALNTTYGSITLTLTDGLKFYGMLNIGGSQFTENPFVIGDVATAVGKLKKHDNTTYELDVNCQLVEHEANTTPKVDISNTAENAYTPAQAIALYNDVTSDLTKEVYVKGVVVATPALKYNGSLTGDAAVYNGTYNVYVKAEDDDSENPTTFEFYRMFADGENATFENGDIQVGELIVAKGTLSKYNSTYEFAQGCQMVSKKSKATMTFDDLEMEVEDVETLAPKTITLATAEAVSYAIKEGSDECVTLEGAQLTATAAGSATIVATVATTEEYIGTSAEFAVTVSAAAPVLTDYYEKVTATENITDGTYLIVYEGDNTHTPVAFNGALETLEAVGNNIPVTITNDKKIAVSEATAAATFFLDVDAGTILSKSGKYIGANSYGNRLDQSDEANTYVNALTIDDEGNAVISISNTSWDGDLTLRYNYGTNNGERFRYYKSGQQPIALYKLANEVVKASPELAWSGDVEITLGETFTAPTLSHADGFTGAITYSSDNEELATVNENGVISLVADATGTAVITASFAGNEDYKAMSAICTITVNAAPTPATTKNVVILAEYNSKFYAMSTTINNETAIAIEVEKDGDNIVVANENDKAAIQWTMTTNGTTATFQKEEQFLYGASGGATLSLKATECIWTWDNDYNCYATGGRGFFYRESGNGFKNYSLSTNLGKTGYSGAPEIIEIDPANIVVTTKVDPELAYDPAEVTLTVGDAFVAPVLGYVEGFDGLTDVTLESSNTNLAVVNEGVVSLVEDAIGTATITATFAGNSNYLAGTASYTITVNEVGDDLSGSWVLATAVPAVGQKFIVAGTYQGTTKTVGEQRQNNRAAVASTLEDDVLTPGAGTKVFTLVDAGDGKFAIQASNGKYLYAAGGSSNNYLREADDYEAVEAKWTITIENGVASVISMTEGDRNALRYNSSSNNELFSCYKSTSQRDIALYVQDTYTRTLEPNRYYTVCLPKKMMEVRGASFWTLSSRNTAETEAYLEEVDPTTAEAGTPFIIQATDTKLEVVYTGAATTTAGTNGALHGTLTYMNADALAAAGTNIYMLYNNALRPVGTNNHLDANRAYINYNELNPVTEAPQPAPGRRVRQMPLQENTATGIDELNGSEAPAKVLINGQLFILRGEKMYDAKGQLVK